MQPDFKRIIISRTDSLGDVVLTLPLAGYLKQQIPGVSLLFLGNSYTRPLIEACEHIDHFLNWEKIRDLPFSEQVNTLRNLQADVILHVFPNKSVARAAKKAGITLRIGTSHRLYHWYTCNKPVNYSRKKSDLHEAQLNFKLLLPLGLPTEIALVEIPELYGLKRIPKLPKKFSELLSRSYFNLIVHPKSKGSAREWGLENFAKLIELLPSDKFKIFVTGTNEEGTEMEAFLKENERQVFDLTGKLTLDELIAFISACDGMVAASTGPLHIAAALKKVVVGLYAPMHPIHPGRWAPLGKNTSYLVLDKTCSDCRKSMDCECIRSISPGEVFSILKNKYNSRD
ncbi:MAG: glycosyltransferase family 9 protein [Bacteroidales bacterium]|nr:glycosyltransferase family 9 protein [Bacteroidales bacterium]